MQAIHPISRNRPVCLLVLLLYAVAVPAIAQEPRTERVWIPEGSYHSIFPEEEGEPVTVESFMLDVLPVTNEEYLKFLKENPKWRKSRIPQVFADPDYLRHWQSDLEPGSSVSSQADRPVTRISWFAGNAYCKAQGGRLPTLAEWEYAAMAMDFDSSQEWAELGSDLISWYSAVDASSPKPVGSSGIQNQYGVQDLHGLVLEWVEDFKPPVADNLSLDCGTAGRLQGDGSLYNYARMVRTLTRMSFKPQTTTAMIGFRCAYDEPVLNQRAEANP